MLVFDASGSMWGQVEGRSKIEIARETFGAMGDSWRTGRTGLIAYGHRRKGDCRDIETLVPVSQGGYPSVSAAIQDLSPKGKTPLSAAVKQAAEHLKYQENVATVVLFSDGVETCDADPCALAAQLEQLGIDFTAHVIGFGITSNTDRAKLQCIAENTGGIYLDAQDAGSLKDALTQLAESPAAIQTDEPSGSSELRLTLELAEGTIRPDLVSIRATNPETGEKHLVGKMTGAAEVLSGLSVQLANGTWLLEAISAEGSGSVKVKLTGAPVELAVPFAARDVFFTTLNHGPYILGAEHAFFVQADGAMQPNAEYSVQLYDPQTDSRLDWEYRFGSDGAGLSWHTFASPTVPGTYEVRVLQGGEVLSRSAVEYVETHTPAWTGELDGEPGGKLHAGVTGSLYYANRFILKNEGQEVQRSRLEELISEEGLFLPLPDQPGSYELSYLYRDSSDQPVEAILATVRVGEVVLPDDPDAEVSNELPQSVVKEENDVVFQVDNAPSQADPATLRNVTSDLMRHYCADQELCLIDIPRLGAYQIPLLKGFGINGADKDDKGRPSFPVFNVENGEWIIYNPTHMQQLTECLGYGQSGERDPDYPAIDTICILRNSNGRTVYQFELLEAWTSARLAAEEQALIASGHIDADGHGPDPASLEDTLFGVWTLTTLDDAAPLGMIRFDPGPDSATATGSIFLENEDLTRLPPSEISIGSVALHRDGAEGVVYSLQFEDGKDQQRTGVLLNRPDSWDGQSQEFVGVLVTNNYRSQFKVRVFR
ncbi:vWA domain-containing protein [Roseibium sp. SCP14]|uniref:vWA domain-containing protein n=1 Tax=Roseibium sp. SCP14 TaxID=3141375 RepID=UPI00333937D8